MKRGTNPFPCKQSKFVNKSRWDKNKDTGDQPFLAYGHFFANSSRTRLVEI